MIPLLIPIRGIHSSMQRLRKGLPDTIVNELVENLLRNTLESIPEGIFEIIILTSDTSLSEKIEDKSMLDKGLSLNQAVSDALTSINKERIALLMPDLPGNSREVMEKLTTVLNQFSQVIVPTSDDGTAFALLNKRHWTNELLGKDSYLKILETIDHEGESIAIHIVQELRRDLDTIEDFEYWKSVVESDIFPLKE